MPQEIPLQLHQVLEEEYEGLHGPFPEGEVTACFPNPDDEKRPFEVKSKRDWDFHEGHIKDPRALVAALLIDDPAPNANAAAASKAGPHDEAKKRLCAYLRGKLSGDEMLRELHRSAGQKGASADRFNALVRDLERGLSDSVLKDAGLYKHERFTYDWLSAETRALLSAPASAGPLEDEDVKRLNRLLLEDAFPEVFRKAAEVRLAAVYAQLHARRQSALCLSGGGIRSGTFALGLMQGLARHGLLRKFEYLSTVSGGGYIGSWLSAWIHRHSEGPAGVERDLASGDDSKVDPDPAPLRYLRRYSNFITPKVGLLTADTWTFVGIYLRNTLLNWMVFVPLILSVLMIPRLLVAITQAQPVDEERRYFLLPALGGGWFDFARHEFYGRYLFLVAGVLLGSWALAYIIFNRPGLRSTLEERRPFFRGRNGQGWFLGLCLSPLLASAFCLTTYFAWSREAREWGKTGYVKFVIFGVGFTFLGWLISSVVLKRLRPGKWRETYLPETLGLLFVGLLGGTLFYLLAQQGTNAEAAKTIFNFPVIGYNKSVETFNWLAPDNWLAWRTEWYVCLAVPAFLLVFLLATVVYIGLTSTHRFRLIQDEEREWWARFGAWILISIIVWLAANLLVIFGPILLLEIPEWLAPIGGLSGLVTLLLARSSKTPAREGEQSGGKVAGLMGSLLPLLALVFVGFIVVGLSLATTALLQGLTLSAGPIHDRLPGFDPSWLTNLPDPSAEAFAEHTRLVHGAIPAAPPLDAAQLVHMNIIHHTWWRWLVAVGVAFSLFGLGLSLIINLNIFSLHGGYRNRLIRAFLGASRPEHTRKPNPFTGFDPADNLHMHELRLSLLDEGDLLAPGIIAARLKRAMTDAAAADEVSRYLVREEKGNERRRERLENARAVLRDYNPDAPPSQRLIADLRADLNSLLKKDSLYKESFAQQFISGERADPRARQLAADIKRAQGLKETDGIGEVRRERVRGDYHVLLNRLILELAYPGAFTPSAYPAPPYKLMHVVNTTLNLVGGGNLAWQQRKAEPFSVSPLHSGCFRVGYRDSRDYGGRETNGISLGTAATASGAAASSNMGYYTTSPVISLLLTLFNVRLGLWLGNPGPHGRDTYHLGSPRLSFQPVVAEAFGMTDDTNKYVYLTDGGHFENLALYEMVLRRCHFIVVSDGAQDEKFRFGDLGNAVRKVRIDLGVPIDFWDVPIYAAPPPPAQGKGVYWALARIRYTCVDKDQAARDGILLYIKPTVYGDEPRDVLEYKESFPAFPHQSTGDQFFDEPQFESYRMLGSHIMDRICNDRRDDIGVEEMMRRAYDGLRKAKPDDLGAVFRLNPKFIDWMDGLFYPERLKKESPPAKPDTTAATGDSPAVSPEE
jgi:hypothetical protein